MFTVEYKTEVLKGMKRLRASIRRQILDRIDDQLTNEPTRETRNRKPLADFQPPWEHEGLVWELRIGEYRVFYEVDEEASRVVVHAVRHKPPHRRTEEIL